MLWASLKVLMVPVLTKNWSTPTRPQMFPAALQWIHPLAAANDAKASREKTIITCIILIECLLGKHAGMGAFHPTHSARDYGGRLGQHDNDQAVSPTCYYHSFHRGTFLPA